jgi:hypothetical protein
MATRGDKFLHALDARYRYANQLQRIDRDIADEQQRFQAAQSYASCSALTATSLTSNSAFKLPRAMRHRRVQS